MNVLGKTGTVEILSALLKEKKMYRDQLSKTIGKKGSLLNDRLKELEQAGLIESEVEDKFQGKKWYWLTEKGKKVAKHLLEIKKIMESKE